MTRDQYRLLGSVIKSKGISGEVVVRTKIATSGIQEKPRFVMVKIDGLPVPFFVNSWQNLSNNEIILRFKDITTKEKAEKFRDKEIWLPRNEFKDFSFKPATEDISGFKVIDAEAGFIGITKGILAIPENDLLRVDYSGREVLIPLQEGIVLEIRSDKKEIRVNLPEGFLQI